ncbi:MAG TPA: glycosyl hydrolase [Firmicutes bacterium]|nr:glycosyl hydrolase [Bacillota bacterium]
MIEVKRRQILIDGKPQLIMAGEIHYYRLRREDWQDRIAKLKAAGGNAVATYVPWLCHEPVEDQLDLEGKTRPELDLGAFIDLCKQNDLYFFVRPGPFIMAEMKNEGIPYWVYKKHPEIVPVSWDGKPVPTKTIDYLAPGFLQEVRKWYAAVMGVIAPRLYTKGGNIIAVQLDNEVGMLSWVSNCPDLTDNVLVDFTAWLKEHYSPEDLKKRYPFDLDDVEDCKVGLRSPREEYDVELMRDLGQYMRNRFARYVETLRSYAEEFGVKGVPFVINIHGTSGGRGLTFPIGISQLYESYTQAPGYIAGSDIYLGNLTMGNFQDLYLINCFMDAVNGPDQPTTSVEFECGDGDYNCTYGNRYDPSAADFKTRMCIAQGNRMLNYYLFAGGINYLLDPKPNDGNDRIALTGERHGFAAPVSPEGELNYTYPRMAHAIKTMMAVSDKLAVMEEEHDSVAFAFIPDYYMTEYCYPGSTRWKEIVKNLEARRTGAWEVMARAMLLSGYRFGSVDVQNKTIDAKRTPVLALGSARYMDSYLQRKLVNYLEAGGGILLYGEIPTLDMEGRPCTILADALGVKPVGVRRESRDFYPTLRAEGWAAPRPEVRTHFAQVFELCRGVPLLTLHGTGEVCGFDSRVGKGRAIVIATAYICDIPFFKTALEMLGAKPGLYHDCPYHGIFMTSTATDNGERFLHILNLDGFDKELHIYDNGQVLFGGRKLILKARDGLMLPVNVLLGDVKIAYSTAEIARVDINAIEFRLTQSEDVIALETEREIDPSEEYTVERDGDKWLVVSRKHAAIADHLTVCFCPRRC